jgi:hypothetical protein
LLLQASWLQFCGASGAGKLVGLFVSRWVGCLVVVVFLGRRTQGGGGLGDEAEEVEVVLSMWAVTGAAIEEEEGRRL